MLALPSDLRRAVWTLLGLALGCLLAAGLYSNHYLFLDPFGRGLPDISPTDSELVFSFQVGAVLCMVWMNALVALATSGPAGVVTRGWRRLCTRETDRPWAWLVALILAGGYAAARIALNDETVHATLAMLTDGQALLPFQYRTLVPWLVAPISERLPGAPLPLLYGLVEAAAAVGVWAAMAYLLEGLGWAAPRARVAALAAFVPLVLNLAAPWRYNAIFFPYDTPSVAFMAVGMGLLVRERLGAFYLLFALATLNRETTCFLVVAWLALGIGRRPWTVLIGHAAALTALWVVLKAGLGTVYSGNTPLGEVGLFTSMVGRSGRILTAVPGWLYLAVVPMGGLATVVWLLRARITDARVRRLAWMVPPFFAGMAVVGELMEVRIYSELIPLVTVGLLMAARTVLRAATPEGADRRPAVTSRRVAALSS